MSHWTIVLPVHNEAKSIAETLKEIDDCVVRKIDASLLVCEDGSTDGTKQILSTIQEQISMKLFLTPRRKGYSRAARDALLLADTDCIVFMDSDGQYDPRDFWKLSERINEADVVMGRRVNREEPWYRRVLSKGLNFLARALFGVRCSDLTSAFRILKKNAAHVLAKEVQYSKYNFWAEFTVRAHAKGYKIIEVPISYRLRKTGSTQVYGPRKLPKIVLNEFMALLRTWWEFRARELLRFATVGLTGAGVILSLLWLLATVGVHYLISAAISIEASIVWAFFWNDRWTFRARVNTHSLQSRLLRYNGVSLLGLGANILILFILVSAINVNYLVAEFFALLIAFAFNFVGSVRWAWNTR